MNCTTMDNPCLTIQYVIDKVAISGDVIKIDGSLGNFILRYAVLISKCTNITFTSYNGVAWIYKEGFGKASVYVEYRTFLLIRSFDAKAKCKMVFNNINFRDTGLVVLKDSYPSKSQLHPLRLNDVVLAVRNCRFDFSKYKNVIRRDLITIRSKNSVINIENCTIKANYQIGILRYPTVAKCKEFLSTQIVFRNTQIDDALYTVNANLMKCTDEEIHRRFELKITNSQLRSRVEHYYTGTQFMIVLRHQETYKALLPIYIENSHFENLSVRANAAAVMDIRGPSKVLIINCTFKGNIGNRGGALAFQSKLLQIVDSKFYDNQARVTTLCAHRNQGGSGGAIFIDDANKGYGFSITNSLFINNMADCLGSAVYLGFFEGVVLVRTQFTTRFTDSSSTIWFSYSFTLIFNQVSFEGREGSKNDRELFFASAEDFIFGKHLPYFKCPIGSVPNVFSSTMTTPGKRSTHVTCNYCPKDEYTLGSNHIFGFNSTNSNERRLHPECQSCSFGAVCQRGIKPKPNFWGYVHKSKAFLIVCPPGYCCQTSDQCTSLNSCNSKRTGRLCGECEHGYFQSFFTNDCVENEACKTAKFWTLAVGICLLFTVLFIFLQDSFLFIVRLLKVDKLVSDVTRRVDWLREKLSLAKKDSVQMNFGTGNERRDSLDNELNDDRKNVEDVNAEDDLSKVQNQSSNYSTASGLIKIVFFYYQIHSILTVYKSDREIQFLRDLKVWLLSIFSLNAQVPSYSEFHCPFHGMRSIAKVWIKALFPVICLIFVGFFFVCVYASSHFFSNNDWIQRYSSKAKQRLLTAILQLTLLGYSTLISSILSLVTCITLVNGDRILYIDGNVPCYQPWQYAILIFIVLWAIPLIFALHKLPGYIRNGDVSLISVYAALILPLPFAIYAVVRGTRKMKHVNVEDVSIDQRLITPVPYVRMQQPNIMMSQLLNVIEGPFRYKTSEEKKEKLSWEPILLLQRIILSLCHTFVLEPGMRSLILLFLIIMFSNINFHYRPFNSGFMNAINGTIFILLCITGIINTFYAFMYEYGSVPKGPLMQLLGIFDYLELMMIMIFPVIAVGALLLLTVVKLIAFCGSVVGLFLAICKRCGSNDS